MIVKIFRGAGSPGKLWTGAAPENGEIVHARIVERKCECGASTRKLRVEKLSETDVAAVIATCDIPNLLVTMGGVGSVSSRVLVPEDGAKIETLPHFQCTNWSGRVGGHVVVNPVVHLVGYWDKRDLPKPKADHYWIQTYCGSTISEFVLLCRSTAHDLPAVGLSGTCPKCREKEEAKEIPEDLRVSRETLAGVVGEGSLFYYESELVLEEGAVAFSARGLHHLAWKDRNAALKAAVEAAKQAGLSLSLPRQMP